MTTASWNTPINMTTDAGFRAWGSEVSAKLAAIGWVQTADTGQINWATVVRPANNTAAGYEIWRFNDTLQGTAPIFFKLEYGMGNANVPYNWITVATGSNGSGTLTGQSSTRTICAPQQAPGNTSTNYQSYACAVDGAGWIENKFNAPSAGYGALGFAISRSCDSNGDPTNVGFVVYNRNTTAGATILPGVQSVRTLATAQTFAQDVLGNFSMNVHGLSSSVFGSNTQAFMHWMPTPQVLPVFSICSMLTAEASFGTTFTTTLVGTTPRTYISVGQGIGLGAPGSGTPCSLCLIYE